jgi:hypothetical protein
MGPVDMHMCWYGRDEIKGQTGKASTAYGLARQNQVALQSRSIGAT